MLEMRPFNLLDACVTSLPYTPIVCIWCVHVYTPLLHIVLYISMIEHIKFHRYAYPYHHPIVGWLYMSIDLATLGYQ